jgi:membrane protein DedA with SNARE-associated domain
MLKQLALELVARHGYGGLFVLLALGIVALPLPDEILLTFAGYLCYKAQLALGPTLLTAFLGSSTGITLSYILGRVGGRYVLQRAHGLMRLSPQRLEKAQRWFEHGGKWSLTFGYFVPGARHVIGIAAGSARMGVGIFALYAYAGTLIWSCSFIVVGFLVGEEWARWAGYLRVGMLVGAGTVVVMAGVIWWVWRQGLSIFPKTAGRGHGR